MTEKGPALVSRIINPNHRICWVSLTLALALGSASCTTAPNSALDLGLSSAELSNNTASTNSPQPNVNAYQAKNDTNTPAPDARAQANTNGNAEQPNDIVSRRIEQAVSAPKPPVGGVKDGASQQALALAPNAKPQKGFLATLFSGTSQASPPKRIGNSGTTTKPLIENSTRTASLTPQFDTKTLANPVIDKTPKTRQSAVITPKGMPMASLPGVRNESLFEIKRKSGGTDDSDVDVNETDTPSRMASVTGLARLTPNGLRLQTSNVDVKCLKPALLRVLKTVERKYRKKPIVTSGYRSPKRNRRARGARNSLHMYCAAVDIQVPGVSKWQLAKFLRKLPGRGGVGTYCHTRSVHIDIGPQRDWNWRCRRKSRRKRR